MATGEKMNRIVVAFDGSKDSVKAVKLASSVATKFHSSLTVVHVYSPPTVYFNSGAGVPVLDYKDLEDAARSTGLKVLARGVQLASAEGVKARGKLLEAQSIVEALSEFALKNEADLIVVGTRGMTGFKKLILGSVSSGLISHAHCPVLVAR
jgi:nucleotide-binding universal stress UspA family protein